MKLTNWFSGKVNPVYVGVYQQTQRPPLARGDEMTTITIDRTTVEQALEALERARPLRDDYATLEYFEEGKRKHYAAMTALRAALAQEQAEPLTIERLRYALVASRIIPPAAVEDPDEYDDGVTLHRIEALHRRLT